MFKLFAVVVVWTALLSHVYALGLDCGLPPPVQDESLKGELDGKARFLSGLIGKAELGGNIQTTKTEIFHKYPKADNSRTNAYLVYMFCTFAKVDREFNKKPLMEKVKILSEFKKEIYGSLDSGNINLERKYESFTESANNAFYDFRRTAMGYRDIAWCLRSKPGSPNNRRQQMAQQMLEKLKKFSDEASSRLIKEMATPLSDRRRSEILSSIENKRQTPLFSNITDLFREGKQHISGLSGAEKLAMRESLENSTYMLNAMSQEFRNKQNSQKTFVDANVPGCSFGGALP